jgi:hypothetical protein
VKGFDLVFDPEERRFYAEKGVKFSRGGWQEEAKRGDDAKLQRVAGFRIKVTLIQSVAERLFFVRFLMCGIINGKDVF